MFVYQGNQHDLTSSLARCNSSSQSPVLTCGPFVTNKSVWESWMTWDFKLLSNFSSEIGIQFSQSENEIKKIVDNAEKRIK